MHTKMICYCFNYTDEDIKKDFITNGKSTIIEKVMHEKRGKHCDCSTKNPKGR